MEKGEFLRKSVIAGYAVLNGIFFGTEILGRIPTERNMNEITLENELSYSDPIAGFDILSVRYNSDKKNAERVELKETKLEDYLNAIFKIESSGNPNASRYEPHIDDTSYGLGQLLTRTAKGLEKRHPKLPRLGDTKEEIKENLCDPEINRRYTAALFQEELDFYRDADLAVAAYNAGHLTPRNAFHQKLINDALGTELKTDGILGKNTRKAVRDFQRDYRLSIDGVLGKQTSGKLKELWKEKNPNVDMPVGMIPVNKYTPNHVRKFKAALRKR